jgi:hypothetical protein
VPMQLARFEPQPQPSSSLFYSVRPILTVK